MSKSKSSPYRTRSPVLFVIFNRPDTTQQVFAKIREARPTRLYIAADGPRNQAEAELCERTRAVINAVDWECRITTLYRDANLGCKEAVAGAVNWFFEQEEEGIILEDDCLPANSFFSFCDELLERYRHDTRIRHISGCNFQHGRVWGNASYYFSNLTHIWGWAGWRRVWRQYDKELTSYHANEIKGAISSIFSEPLIAESWLHIFNELKAGRIDTWDYQLTFLNFFNHSLSIIPNQNLISNIGFGAGATHTVGHHPNANIPVVDVSQPLTHPLLILPEKAADVHTLNYDFNVAARRRKQKSIRRWLQRLTSSKLQPYSGL